jgi:poly(3-hydroxybutyrate) depolymerase
MVSAEELITMFRRRPPRAPDALRYIVAAGLVLAACSDGGTAPDGPVSYEGTFPAGAGLHEEVRLTVGGVARTLWTYVPVGVGPSPALAIVFHETDGAASGALEGSGAIALADSQKLVLVAPQARTMASGDWDNHVAGQRYFETYPNASPGANKDLLLVRAIILEAQRAHGCDAKRVYAVGLSNGAFFATFAAFTLSDRVAGFAEAAGGLVTCPATSGCTFSSDAATSCGELASQPGYCSCSGEEKPAPLPAGGRKPAGYLAHAANDTTVSVYYTCSLASRMQALGFPTSVAIRPSGGHDWPPDLAVAAWPFLSQHPLP